MSSIVDVFIVAHVMPTVTLYTTDHCSLCATALDWLQGCSLLRGVRLQTVDVALADELLKEFGERVPVLAVGDRTLDWPFTEAGVSALIAPAPPGRG